MEPNIIQAAQAFTQWRATRSKRSHTPTHLKELASALVDHYPVAEICAQLKINARSLKSWSEQHVEPHSQFVTITEEPAQSVKPAEHSVQLKICAPGGFECYLSGDLTAPFVVSLLRVIDEGAA